MNIYGKFDSIAEEIRKEAKRLGVTEGVIGIQLEVYHPEEAIDNKMLEEDLRRSFYPINPKSSLPERPPMSIVEGGIDIPIGRLLGEYECRNRGTEVLLVRVSVSGGDPEQNEQMAWAALPILYETLCFANHHVCFQLYLFSRDIYDKIDEMGLR